MHSGAIRNSRALIYMQAVLVWGLKEVNAKAWINHGRIGHEQVEADPELEWKVQQHIHKIEAAGGKFVMPE